MSEITLKPCPFCGGRAELVEYTKRVCCTECNSGTKSDVSLENLIAAWNRRVDDDGLPIGEVIKITRQNSREILPKMSRKQLIETVRAVMDLLDEQARDVKKCVGIIEHFELAYKTGTTQQIIDVLASVFDDKPVERKLQ